MTKKVKVTSLLLALTFTLAACGADNNENNSNESNNNELQKTEESTNKDTTANQSTSEDSKVNDEDTESTTDATEQDTKAIEVTNFSRTMEDAIKEAKSKFDGELTEIGIDETSDRWVYEIELESEVEEYEVSMDVNTLEVIKENRETEDDLNDNKYFDYRDLVKIEDAITTATGKVDGKVTEASTDWENQQLYYEVTILKTDGEDVDVIIDAYSGDFVEIDD